MRSYPKYSTKYLLLDKATKLYKNKLYYKFKSRKISCECGMRWDGVWFEWVYTHIEAVRSRRAETFDGNEICLGMSKVYGE